MYFIGSEDYFLNEADLVFCRVIILVGKHSTMRVEYNHIEAILLHDRNSARDRLSSIIIETHERGTNYLVTKVAFVLETLNKVTRHVNCDYTRK